MHDRAEPGSLAALCLSRLHDDALQIDEGLAIDVDGGFAWWPGPIRQAVTAQPMGDGPDDGVRLEITTELWSFREIPAPPMLDYLQQLGTLSGLGMVNGALQLSAVLLVYPELSGWQLRLASWIAAVQIGEAADIVELLKSDSAPGRPIGSEHPTMGHTEKFDSIIEVRDFLAASSENAAADVLTVTTLRSAAQAVSGDVRPIEQSEVFAVGQTWTSLPAEAQEAGLGEHPVVSYIGLTAHPRVGPGFGIRTFFPLEVEQSLAGKLVGLLNADVPGWTLPRVGGWIAQDTRLLIQTFLPAAMVDGPANAGAILGNVLIYHERMMALALELAIDEPGALQGPL